MSTARGQRLGSKMIPLLLASLAACSPMLASEAFELAPGLVVGPSRETLYLMRPAGGVEAVESSSGASRWTSSEADRPLYLQGDVLLAQVAPSEPGSLRLVAVDKFQGRTLRRFEIPLPDGIVAALEEGLGWRFSVETELRDGRILISWLHVEKTVEVAPPAEAPNQERRREGAAWLDLANGDVELVDPRDVPEEAVELPANLSRLLAEAEFSEKPWRGGAVWAATSLVVEGGRSVFSLQRWSMDTGEPLPEKVLQDARPIAHYPSADGAHLLVSNRVESSAASWNRYGWSVWSVETAELVGELASHVSVAPFFVDGQRLGLLTEPFGRQVEGTWMEEPRKLRVFSLETGSELWSKPLRDLAYRGPRPPR